MSSVRRTETNLDRRYMPPYPKGAPTKEALEHYLQKNDFQKVKEGVYKKDGQSYKLYQLQRGDSLWKLAKQYWQVLYADNRGLIYDPDKIREGHWIIVPEGKKRENFLNPVSFSNQFLFPGVKFPLAEAEEWEGVPYKWGGNSKDGIDCSHFIYKLIPHRLLSPSAENQYRNLKKMGFQINPESYELGKSYLMFSHYKNEQGTWRWHVMLVIPKDYKTLYLIQSSGAKGGVTIEEVEWDYRPPAGLLGVFEVPRDILLAAQNNKDRLAA